MHIMPSWHPMGAFVHSARTACMARILQGEIGEFWAISNILACVRQSAALQVLLAWQCTQCCVTVWLTSTSFGDMSSSRGRKFHN